jgi:predicted  nucleic acid-binding Zn-ribbon protein
MGLFRRATDAADIERIKADMTALREAMERHRAELDGQPPPPAPPPDPRLDELATKIADLDARITAVSTELANQLTELGHDIDALNDRGDAPTGELTELRDGQVRLANEQARYQIAFREDLARLAEQLKRSR